MRARLVHQLERGIVRGALNIRATVKGKTHQVLPDGLLDGVEIFGKGREDLAARIEDHDRDAVARAKYANPLFSGGSHFGDPGPHTTGDIEQKDEVERFLPFGELHDRFRVVFVEDPEIVAGQTVEDFAFGVGDFHVDVDQRNTYVKGSVIILRRECRAEEQSGNP